MDHLKQLDDVLEFLDDGDRPATSFLSIKREFTEISDRDLYLILDKLLSDGYVIYEQDSKSRYSITYNGLMFLSYGGYTEQDKRTKRKYRQQFILNRALICGGGGALIAGLYALWKIFQVIYSAFFASLPSCF